MRRYGVPPAERPPAHVVRANAGFTEVVQYTDWYVADRGLDSWPNYRGNQPNYRYRRYLEVLRLLSCGEQREAHVDIGCGAGLFSWAFLDWTREQLIEPDSIDLYGYDHCRSMISLANMIRAEMNQQAPDYPVLQYDHDLNSFLRLLTTSSRPDTDYNVTLGHVLVQSHSPQDTLTFTRIILHVLDIINPNRNCLVMALDSRRSAGVFAASWTALLRSLVEAGVRYEPLDVPRTAINNASDAKVAWIHHSGQ